MVVASSTKSKRNLRPSGALFREQQSTAAAAPGHSRIAVAASLLQQMRTFGGQGAASRSQLACDSVLETRVAPEPVSLDHNFAARIPTVPEQRTRTVQSPHL